MTTHETTTIQRIAQLLEAAHCEEVDGYRCFIVGQIRFFAIIDILLEAGFEVDSPEGWIRRNKRDAVIFRASSKDTGQYLICSETEVFLDNIWDRQYKPKSKGAQS